MAIAAPVPDRRPAPRSQKPAAAHRQRYPPVAAGRRLTGRLCPPASAARRWAPSPVARGSGRHEWYRGAQSVRNRRGSSRSCAPKLWGSLRAAGRGRAPRGLAPVGLRQRFDRRGLGQKQHLALVGGRRLGRRSGATASGEGAGVADGAIVGVLVGGWAVGVCVTSTTRVTSTTHGVCVGSAKIVERTETSIRRGSGGGGVRSRHMSATQQQHNRGPSSSATKNRRN